MLESDRERGILILIASSVVFLYYTAWVFGLPFFEDTQFQNFFLSHDVALLIPAIIGLCFIGGLIIFIIYHVTPYVLRGKTATD